MFKQLADGILKFFKSAKESFCLSLCEDTREVAKVLKTTQKDKYDDLEGDNLKREIAKDKEKRDDEMLELLKQIEENTRD